MSVIVDLVLGIVTSIGGFVEVGSISTSAQAGSEYGFQLLWAIAVAGAASATHSVAPTVAPAKRKPINPTPWRRSPPRCSGCR